MIRYSSSVGGWVLKWKLLWSGGCWCYFTIVYVDFFLLVVELQVNRKGSILMFFWHFSFYLFAPATNIIHTQRLISRVHAQIFILLHNTFTLILIKFYSGILVTSIKLNVKSEKLKREFLTEENCMTCGVLLKGVNFLETYFG